ncbi:hypothetical protein [Pseudonocardia sp.]|uniref:hypothetical protein n=1 Tax=Pseudonocardia sp. TaxID=60912 RepID=UPI0031FDD000
MRRWTLARLIPAGLYRMWTPKDLGGLEIDPVSGVDLVERVARIDAAAGWNLCMSLAPSVFGMWLPDDGAREVFAGAGTADAGGKRARPASARSAHARAPPGVAFFAF